tara:strand:+ start:6865 stop:7281 length:417 start_codon:yes stop_codon:yes gene_type:complete
MVKHTARDFRALTRKVRQLEKMMHQKDQATVKNEHTTAEKDADAAESVKQAVFAKAHYAKQLALERQTSALLRKSLENFRAPLYKLKRVYKRLHNENAMLTISLKNTRASKRILEEGIKRLQLSHALKKHKRKRKCYI